MTIYGYAVDLAEELNYCGITVLAIDRQMQIKDLRKFKNVHYPAIRELMMNEMFPIMPPTYIAVDYTSEKSFSEELEYKMNPTFNVAGSSGYNKWKYVEPYVFTSDLKMAFKQNAKSMLENKRFQMPMGFSSPEMKRLWDECYAQLLREVFEPKVGGGFKVPKPTGSDNDLAMSLEMNLYKGKDYLASYGDIEQVPLIMTYSLDDEDNNPYQSTPELFRRRLVDDIIKKSPLSNIKVKVKLSEDDEFR